MSHKFPKAVFPDDYETKELVQPCEICGLVRIKYRGGGIAYVNPDGNRTSVIPAGCKDVKKELFDCMVLLRVATDELQDGRIKNMCKRFIKTA